MPKYCNSLDKVVYSYFAAVSKKPFTYNGKTVEPRCLRVSTNLCRGFSCPAACGGCCPRFSLEYLPSEVRPANGPIDRYEVEFNGKPVLLWHDKQDDHDDHFCRYLDRTNARCGVYPRRPFHCDFELIRVFSSTGPRPNLLTQQMFGRGWQFLRIDGKRGALCEMTARSPESTADVLRKLKRLKEWTDHFGLETWLDTIIEWVGSGCIRTLHLMPEAELDKQLKILE